jgi:hypothetical protein
MLNFLKRKRQVENQAMGSDESAISLAEQIGVTSGQVWQLLAENGEMNLSQLVKQVDASRDSVMQAVGWLARESKISIAAKHKVRLISLVGDERSRAA